MPIVIRDNVNGIPRPSYTTVTGRVWEIADEITKKLGRPAPRKDVLDKCAKEKLNPSTAATQYGRWRTFNGYTGRVK